MFKLIKNEEHKEIDIYIDVGSNLMKLDKIKVETIKNITVDNNVYTCIKMEYVEEKKKMFTNKLIEVTEEETGLVVKEAAGSQGKKRIF